MGKGIRVALAILAFLATSAAGATVVTWSLDGEFDDGGVANGFFTLNDTPSIALSNYDIKVSGGNFPDFEYTPASASGEIPGTAYVLFGSQGSRSLGLYFFPGVLWDESDSLVCCVTYPLDSGISFEGTPPSPIRFFQFGAVITSVPEPSTYALMLAGIATIAAFARRRTRR
jgi:PEP-CTERM motif